MPAYFFESTPAFLDAMTEAFDFIWPTAIAKWYLRGQVQDYLQANPGISPDELEQHFAAGSGFSRANLRSASVDTTWAEDQQKFARFLLINACGLFDSWISETLFSMRQWRYELAKQLQYPTWVTAKGDRGGIWGGIDELTQKESPLLKNGYYAMLSANKRNSKGHLDNLLACYRFFKECRNAMVHTGGKATKLQVDAYRTFAAVATPADLGIGEVPEHEPVVFGQPIVLHLRGLIGLTDILQRIVITLDAELVRSIHAEHELKTRWRETFSHSMAIVDTNPKGRAREITTLLGKVGFPVPANPADFEKFLFHNRLVRNPRPPRPAKTTNPPSRTGKNTATNI